MSITTTTEQITDDLIYLAWLYGQRTGQILFNLLPLGAREAVTGSLFDPFYKDLTSDEASEWLDSHIIFDDEPQGFSAIFDSEKILAVFDGEKILWER
jgi:hypothetical protein